MQYIGLYAKARHYMKVCLGVSKDQLLKKHPDLKDAIEFFFQKAPNGNPKYVEWELKVLQARQAMKEEIADVIALFDKFRNRLQKKDLFQYQASDFTGLRDQLFVLRDEQANKKDERQKKVEKRYQNEPEAIACGHKVIYASEDLKCIQILNKAASMHYGLGTQWCIAMKDASYFEDYDKSNVVFFFLFNKKLDKSSPYYKVAFAYQRGTNNEILGCDHFDANDRQFDSAQLAGRYMIALRDTYNDQAYSKYQEELSKVYPLMIDIAKSYPKSLLARIYSNEVPVDEVVKLYENEQNREIKTYIEKWLVKNNSLAPDDTIGDIASTTTNEEAIYELAKSKSPTVLGKLVDNMLAKQNVAYLDTVADNQATPTQSIENIFKYMGRGGRIYMDTEALQGALLRNKNCPIDRLEYYARNSQGIYLLECIARNPNAPTNIIDRMLQQELDKKIKVPQFLADLLKHPNASQELLQQAFEKDPGEGYSMMKNSNLKSDMIRQIFNYWKKLGLFEQNDYIKANLINRLAKNNNTPSDILETIYNVSRNMQDNKTRIQAAILIASNPNTPKGLVSGIMGDPVVKEELAGENQ